MQQLINYTGHLTGVSGILLCVAAGLIAYVEPHDGGIAFGVARNAHGAAHGLDDEVIGGPIAIGPGPAEARKRAIDDPRVDSQ